MATTTPQEAPWPSGELAMLGDPRREMILGLVLVAGLFCGLVAWGGFVRMDAAASAQGTVIVSGRRQTVQAADGGVVTGLFAREGQAVRAGQLLISLAPAQARADETALARRAIELQAQLARIGAEQDGRGSLTPPAMFAALPDEEKGMAQAALAREAAALADDIRANQAQVSALRARAAQSDAQVAGYKSQLAANQRQLALNDQELAAMKDLASQGYAPTSRVRALEQSGAALQGQSGAAAAALGQVRAAGSEARFELAQALAARSGQLSETRRRLEADLDEVTPKLAAAKERLARTQVRSPVAGRVLGLVPNTMGAVVVSGQPLMDIVPDRAGTVVEARLTPADGAAVRPGDHARVHLPAGRDGRPVVVDAVVARVGADALTDARTDQGYVPVEISLHPRAPAQESAVRPGVPVGVVIPVRKRTALQYWLEPLTQSFSRSMHER
jgi:HlyD family secretion protein